MIKYLGSKRALLDVIVQAIGSRVEGATVLDLFSGTSRVGHALKARCHRVIANDNNAYAHVLALLRSVGFGGCACGCRAADCGV